MVKKGENNKMVKQKKWKRGSPIIILIVVIILAIFVSARGTIFWGGTPSYWTSNSTKPVLYLDFDNNVAGNVTVFNRVNTSDANNFTSQFNANATQVFTSGKKGNSKDVSYLLCSNSTFGSVFNNDWTISFWVNTTTQSGMQEIFGQSSGSEGGLNAYIGQGGHKIELDMTFGTGGCRVGAYLIQNATGNGYWNDGGWHHIVITSSGNSPNFWNYSNLNFWVDGTPYQVTADSYNPSQTGCGNNFAGQFGLGGRNYGSNPIYFPGKMDEFAIWTRALNQTEVTNLYNNQTGYFYGEVFTDVPANIYITSPIGQWFWNTINISWYSDLTPKVCSYWIDNRYLAVPNCYQEDASNLTQGNTNSSCTQYQSSSGGWGNWTEDGGVNQPNNQHDWTGCMSCPYYSNPIVDTTSYCLHDGNKNTCFALQDNYNLGTIEWNYTKPSSAVYNGSIWSVTDGVTSTPITYNLTIPYDCWTAYPDKLRFQLAMQYFNNNANNWNCWNGTTWKTARVGNGVDYEDSMYWNISIDTSVNLTGNIPNCYQEDIFNLTQISNFKNSTCSKYLKSTNPINWSYSGSTAFWGGTNCPDQTTNPGGCLRDGRWDTGVGLNNDWTSGFVEEYYTKPIGASRVGTIWTVADDAQNPVSHNGAMYNLTFPADCWNAYSDKLRLGIGVAALGTGQGTWQCWNGTSQSYIVLRTGARLVYEEAIWWNITTDFYDVTINNTLAFGNHNVSITCLNGTNMTAIQGFYYGNQIPVITVYSPNKTIYNTSIVLLNFSASPSTGNISSLWWNNGTGTNQTYTTPINLTLPDGSYNFYFWANDSSNKTGTANFSFKVDTTPPYFTNVQNQTINDTLGLSYQINGTDTTTSVSCFIVNDTNFAITCGGLFTNNTRLYGYKVYTLNITANDTINNKNSTIITITVLDKTLPTISLTQPSNLGTYNVTSIPLIFSVTELSNITWYAYSLDGGINISFTPNITLTGLIEGKHNITLWVNDSYNNYGKSITNNFTIDLTSPNATALSPFDGNMYNTASLNYTANASDNLGLSTAYLYIYNNVGTLVASPSIVISGVQQVAGIVVSLGDGIYTWFYKILDLGGNTGYSQNQTITIDATPPVTSIVSPQAMFYNNNIISMIYNVTDLHMAYCWYSINNGITNVSTPCGYNVIPVSSNEGVNNWIIAGNDTAGNKNMQKVTFTVDTIYPTAQYVNLTDLDGSFLGVGINVNVTANDTNLKNITTLLYDSTGTLINFSTTATSPNYKFYTVSSDGDYYFNATICDYASNCINLPTRHINIDTTAPIFTNLGNLTYYDNQSVSYTFTASDPAGIGCYKVNDTTRFNISCSGLLTNKTSLAWGNYYYTISVNDTLGNTRTSPALKITYVSSDLTPPLVAIYKNQSQVEYKYGSILVNWSATDIGGNGVNQTRFNVTYPNGTLLYSNNSFNGSKVLTSLTPEGTYTLNIWANDSSTWGNSASTSDTFIVRDTINPYFTGISNISVIESQGVNLKINASDDGVGVSCFSVNDSRFAINCSGTLTNSSVLPTTLIWLNITVTDSSLAGNKNYALMYVNVSDTRPPYFTNIRNFVLPDNVGFNYTFTAIDREGNFGRYSINDTTRFSINQTSGFIQNITNLTKGTYYINLTINDSWGNKNSSIFSVTIYSTAKPNITIYSPLSNILYNNLYLNWSVSSLENLSWCGYSTELYPNSTDTTIFNFTSKTAINKAITNIPEGYHSMTIFCNDTWGNMVNYTTNIIYDMYTPSITVNNPISDGVYPYSSIRFYATSNDTDSVTYYYSMNNGTFVQFSGDDIVTIGTAGTYRMTYLVNDSMGLSSQTSFYITVTTSVTPPNPSGGGGGGGGSTTVIVGNEEPEVTRTDGNNGSITTLSVDYQPFIFDGDNVFEVKLVDGGGNPVNADNISIQVVGDKFTNIAQSQLVKKSEGYYQRIFTMPFQQNMTEMKVQVSAVQGDNKIVKTYIIPVKIPGIMDFVKGRITGSAISSQDFVTYYWLHGLIVIIIFILAFAIILLLYYRKLRLDRISGIYKS